MYCDMWLPGDYLIRYYSLCDIGILAPVFVMVIEFHLCDIDEFCLCDNNYFHLCDGDELRLCDGIFSSGYVLVISSIFVVAD